jgi:hypothetical protein
MSELENYYNEHASQARQHEDQREHMTNILLAVAGVLIGLITHAELSLSSLPAAVALIVLGIFGFLFAGKHYERFKFHTEIMSAIRDDIDCVKQNPKSQPKPLKDLRSAGAKKHYEEFVWPTLSKTDSKKQANARSWIARQRLHVFWEAVHVLVAVIGLALSISIVIKWSIRPHMTEPLKVQIVK